MSKESFRFSFICPSNKAMLYIGTLKKNGYGLYSWKERLFKTNFSPQKQRVVHYERYVFKTS